MQLHDPWLLLLLVLVPLVVGRLRRAPRSALRFPVVASARAVRRGARVRLRGFPHWMLGAALALLVVALARPQLGRSQTQVFTEGIDIILAVDISSSMLAEDFAIDGRRANRLKAVKTEVRRFLEKRGGDRVGLVLFGARPYLQAPLTLDHDLLRQNLAPMTIEVDLAGPINYARRVVGGWGAAHKAAMREQFGRVLSVGGIGESLPNPASYVDLDAEEKDAHGLPKGRIHSRLAEMEIQRLAFIAKMSRQALEAAGVEKRVEEFGTYDMFNATHVFGTCRMGTDPETSVVDAYCRSHRWRNLLVTDASIFSSSGGGEAPSLTIYANSLRAAHYLKEQGIGKGG